MSPLALDLSRRHLLQAGGALLVSFSTAPLLAAKAAAASRPALTPDQLDSFIALQSDGTAIAFFGKMDPGQGVDVAIGQIVAEELDLPAGSVQVIQGDTGRTVNQGGASGSTGIEKGGVTLRYAAAEARRILVERAAVRLGVPPEQLATENGAVFVAGAPAKRVLYKELLGDGYFETALTWNGQMGNDLLSRGRAQPKPPSDYKVVGQSVPRTDIRDNAFARQTYVTDIRVPGMLHARMIRPPVVGAEPEAIDAASVKDIPGVRIFHERGFVAVLAEKEWNAIRAAEALRVTWTKPVDPLPDQARLYDYLRMAPALARKDEVMKGDVATGLAGAAKIVSATYEWPFQSHA